MKKKYGMILAAALLVSMALCAGGCGSAGDSNKSADGAVGSAGKTESPAASGTETEPGEKDAEISEPESGNENSDEGFYFIVDGVKLATDMDMDEMASQLGESKSVFEAPSCAGEGIAYLYNYSSFEIETYPAADGKNRIGYITLKDDTVATPDGLDLSMTKADVIRIYGEDYEEIESKFTYEKNGTKLNIIFDGDNVISIEYTSVVMG